MTKKYNEQVTKALKYYEKANILSTESIITPSLRFAETGLCVL